MLNFNVSQDAKETSKKIKLLIEQGELEEAIKFTEEYPYDSVIQSQRISIAFMQNDLKKVREIAEKEEFKNQRAVFSQRIKLALLEKKTEEAEYLIREAEGRHNFIDQRILSSYKKSLRNQKKEKELYVRTFFKKISKKLSDGTIEVADIEAIKNDTILSKYGKVCMLLAVCEKKKNGIVARNIYEQYKATKPKEESLRRVKRIMQRFESKRNIIFDSEFYEIMLGLKKAPKIERQIVENPGNVGANSFEESLRVDSIDYSKAINESLANSNNKEIAKKETESK